MLLKGFDMTSEQTHLNTLSVDCVIFGLDEGELKVLLIKRKEEPFTGNLALPGGFVRPSEDLEVAAQRILDELTGIKNVYMEQVFTFGKVERFPSGRVISIAYYTLVKRGDRSMNLSPREIDWHPVSAIPKLVFDHNDILRKALDKLKHKVTFHPVGFELLPEKFTLTQLQKLYEKILGKLLDKRNFRKRVLSINLVIQLEESQIGVAHRAARYYRFDQEKYIKFLAQGFNFKI